MIKDLGSHKIQVVAWQIIHIYDKLLLNLLTIKIVYFILYISNAWNS